MYDRLPAGAPTLFVMVRRFMLDTHPISVPQYRPMDENWIEFEDGPSSSQDRLLVSMNTRAAIFINRAAMDELNHPEAVTLHFDTANDRIGIKSAAPLTPNAFKVVPDKRSRAGRISAVSFAARHEIKFDYNVRFLGPVMYKGMLVVSLNQARRSSRKRNARRR